ncbi:MAG: hypothetical protein K2L07_06190 [Lachnospiraceae bacterium]|nr:hypothetical protein [Lachnospiraceae bacterium]
MNHAAIRIYAKAYNKTFHKLYLSAYEEGYKEALGDYTNAAIKRMLDNHFDDASIQLALEVSATDIERVRNPQSIY